MVDTRKAPRRALRFESIPRLRDELATVEAAHRAGTLRTTGNWTPGQVLGHLAAWASYPYDGYPMNPPGWIRLLGRLTKRRFTRQTRPMPAGFRIHGAPEGTFGVENLEFDEGVRRLHAALDRLETTTPTIINPVFGRLSHAEWVGLNLNHAALHLGFLKPG
jgi:hypothetical protein